MGNGRFYMLALSQKRVRLFLGSHYSISEVRLLRGLAEAMKYEEVEWINAWQRSSCPRTCMFGGRFNRRTREVSTTGVPQPENEDLLDLAAVRTLDGNGTVFAVEREELPAKGPCAAIFR